MAIHSHENAYKMLGDLRLELNEYSADLLTGTDTSGNYNNAYLTKKLNEAQSAMHMQLFRLKPEIFLSRTTIVGVASVYTLPHNFGKMIEFRDSDGNKMYPTSVKSLPTPVGTGSDQLYFREGNTLVLTKSGITETCALYYFRKPRLLLSGTAGASSGASALHMSAATAVLHDDYYNGITVDDYTASFTSIITDWTASTQVAVVTGTAATSDIYGTVSELPEEFHLLIVPLAELLVSSVHPAAQRKPSEADWKRWSERFFETLWAYGANSGDEEFVDLFSEYSVGPSSGGFNIPGQGHTIY